MEIIALIGYGISVICGIYLIILAFKESVIWGIGCLFLPFIILFFVITHWDVSKKPFLVSLAGSAMIILGGVLFV